MIIMTEKKLCRVCANLADAINSENLFGRSQRSLLRQIEDLTGLKLKYVDSLPLLICEACQEQTERAHNFRERCIRAQQQFITAECKNQIEDGCAEADTSIESNALHAVEYEVDELKDEVDELKDEVVELLEEVDEEQEAENEHEDEENYEDYRDTFIEIEEVLLTAEDGETTKEDYEFQEFNDDDKLEVELDDATTVTNDISLAMSPKKKPIEKKQKKALFCEECDQHFNSRTTFWYHRKLHDGTAKTLFSCKICNSTFGSSSTLWYHKKKHEGTYVPPKTPPARRIVDLYCDQCGKHFRDRNNLKDHLKRHAGIKPFQCEICPKKFASKPEVRVHLRSHTGEQPFTCRYCDVRFRTMSGRSVHERKHRNVRPYTCNECGKAFTTSSSLKTHMNTHSDERPFECKICRISFTCQKNLNGHNLSKTHQKNEKIQQELDISLITSTIEEDDNSFNQSAISEISIRNIY